MRRLRSPDTQLGLLAIAMAIVVVAVWIPFDVETGLVEKFRRQVQIGDALLPTLAMAFVFVGGVMVAVQLPSKTHKVTAGNALFLVKLLVCLGVALVLMRWLGPVAVSLSGEEATYRALRDTAPWKYIGFVVGGAMLTAGLMALVEGRLSLRGVVVGTCAALILVAVYDLPFEDLLLPPNGDV